jgi:hypothetical protein
LIASVARAYTRELSVSAELFAAIVVLRIDSGWSSVAATGDAAVYFPVEIVEGSMAGATIRTPEHRARSIN